MGKKKQPSFRKRPNTRQKKVLANLGKGMSMKQSMLKAGYSPSYAKNAGQLMDKNSWKELIDMDLPESLITGKIGELLDSTNIHKYTFAGTLTEKAIHVIMKKLGFEDEDDYHIVKTPTEVNDKGEALAFEWGVFYSRVSGMDVARAVDMSLKVRGKYAPQEIRMIDDPLKLLSDEELEKEIIKAEEEVRLSYIKEAKDAQKAEAKRTRASRAKGKAKGAKGSKG